MKKIIFFTIVFIVFLASVIPVSAHTLKIDKNIGVNLHVDPDDSPISGLESKFLLEIQDKSGRFNPNNPANCDCTLNILQEGVLLKTLPIVAGGTYAQLRFTFPAGGVYQVVVEGKPKGEGIPFQQFHTEFEYFVQSDNVPLVSSNDTNGLLPYVQLIAFGIGVLVILMFVL